MLLYIQKSVLLLILYLSASFAYAQNPPKSAAATANLTLNPVIGFTKTKTNTSPLNFSTFASYQNGITLTSFVKIDVKSTENWIVNLKASNANFTASGGGASNSIPASILSFKTGTETNFKSLSSIAQTLNTGSSGGPGQTGNSFNMDLRAQPGFNFPSGIYTIDLVFTITNQ